MRAGPLLAALAVLLAGCVSLPPTAPASDAGVTPVLRSFALSPEGALVESSGGSPTTVPLDWGWRQWLDGTPPPAWQAPGASTPFLILNATATVVYVAESPALTTKTRPELTVWWGVGEALVHHAFLDGPDALAPGDTFEAVFELELPRGGLAVGAGERPVLRVGSYYTDDAGRGALGVRLMDDAALTRLDLLVVPFSPGSAREESVVEAQGTMEGGRCMGLDPATERDLARHEFDVPEGTLGLRVVLDRVGGTGPSDVDFALLDGAGEVVGSGQGPGAHEEITLREPNLALAAPGTWALVVYNCTPQASAYAVTVHRLLPA